jgi:glucose-fructose oxidoreductase
MEKIRYAVIGLGHIAQRAVLPAFQHAENSELVALITGSPDKDRELSKRYGVNAYAYDDLETAIEGENVDAVYIATPNSLHREDTERAARAYANGARFCLSKPVSPVELANAIADWDSPAR